MNIDTFISAVLRQDADAIRTCFQPDAYVNWHNTNEHFTVEEYIRANCEYPGQWTGKMEGIVESGDMLVTAIHVQSLDGKISCHCTSFIRLADGRIASMDEYWGDDGEGVIRKGGYFEMPCIETNEFFLCIHTAVPAFPERNASYMCRSTV